jgi:hypothetical protein
MQDVIECDNKIVTALRVENDRIYETEYFDFSIACVDSPTGQCPCQCSHQDESCKCKDLEHSIRVAVTKTPVQLIYPLSNPKMFNGRPHEV